MDARPRSPSPAASLATAAAPPPARSEQIVHQAHFTLALLSTVIHSALLLFALGHDRGQLPVLGTALGISAVFAVALALGRIPLGALTTLASFGLPLWLGAEILRTALGGGGVPPQYYVTVGIVTVMVFSSLPPRRAFVITGVMLLGISATVLRFVPLETPLLLYAIFLTSMIAFLALYGQSVHTERVRGELLHTLAHTDPLTGALNRRGGTQHLDTLLGQPSVFSAAVLLLDIDRFKGINDTHGHALGDEVLTGVARVTQDAAGPGATVTRWGGEEFLVMWPDLEPQEVYAAASRLLEAVRALRVGALPGLTVSAGLAFASEAQERDELVNLADRRMYAAKQAGGDRWL